MEHSLQYGQAHLGAVAALGGKDSFGGCVTWFFSFLPRYRFPAISVHIRVSELLGEFGHAGLEGVEEKRVVEAVEVGGGEGSDLGFEIF
ncbi:ATP-dependent RNA helicase mss116, putative [Babesia ovata]|uniref:ATP-dependent RNA helicase mss116, putative n=1 Tax=Babesia ovata TaxID=189622 RepID=A0A2H6KJ45_9APIC|nr:ATP-dependent RNA helicase mss116, putative [Babesia ovata]GBE63010.1 ATP-dependent RNA helicase mss116, putative [Babesia ovata]